MYRFEEGYALMQAFIGLGVVGDFRAPDLLLAGATVSRYVDVWEAVTVLRECVRTRARRGRNTGSGSG